MAPSIRIFSDGKVGDEVQCRGVAEALGSVPDIRHISPRRPYIWFMPWGPIDPKDAIGRSDSPVSHPFPDLAIASGRRTVPYLRKIKKASGGSTMTVFLKDPRTGLGAADLIWVPEHDKLRGSNVIVTTTAPHRITLEKLKSVRDKKDDRILGLSSPRILVIVGGNSRHHRFQPDDIERFVSGLENLVQQGGSLMVTSSRRTPTGLVVALSELVSRGNHMIWTGNGENPYVKFLAWADFIIVTADSTNMVGEAVSTGKPVLVFEPSGGHEKIRRFMAKLSNYGAIKPFKGQLENLNYKPINSTQFIANEISRLLAVKKQEQQRNLSKLSERKR